MKKIVQIALEKAKQGEVLGVDVLDPKGNRLLAAGSELSEEARKLLYRRGIKHIGIERKEDITPEQMEIMRKEIGHRLNRQFRNVQDSVQMQKFMGILLDYRMNAL